MNISELPISEQASVLEKNIANLSDSSQQFAKSLLNQLKRRALSEKQEYWLTRLATESSTPKAEREQVALPTNVPRIVELFKYAGSRIKTPKITIGDEHVKIRMSICGERSKYTGAINVFAYNPEGILPTMLWAGRIGLDGKYTAGKKVTDEGQKHIITLLRTIDLDPHTAIEKYAKRSGNCCLCNKSLSAEKSVVRGVGPVCYSKWFAGAPTSA